MQYLNVMATFECMFNVHNFHFFIHPGLPRNLSNKLISYLNIVKNILMNKLFAYENISQVEIPVDLQYIQLKILHM